MSREKDTKALLLFGLIIAAIAGIIYGIIEFVKYIF
jgi:hypothetical protein